MRDDNARAAAVELGGDRGAPILHVDEGVLLHADHSLVERQRRSPSHVLGTSGKRRAESLLGAIVERQDVVLERLLHEGRGFEQFGLPTVVLGLILAYSGGPVRHPQVARPQ